MTQISEQEFARLCRGIADDREQIIKHNPIGSEAETLLWMLLSCLVSYMSLSDLETPCFTGRPDAKTYREAILFVLTGRKAPDFEPERYLSELAQPIDCEP